ncbi:hypothetical protein MJO29_011311 [Puccinia striiformis f. sp. tritici]|nr:hypothetical protein MJO29_011311 [Puccinia striiformis f. sp. tritici]
MEQRKEGELVFKGFQRLARKCVPKKRHRYPKSSPDTTVGLYEGKQLLNRLKSTLLPLLNQQLETISGLLDPYNPSDSQENQAGLLNLELILKTQRELEENLNRIYSSFYPLCPRDPGGVSNQTEDHHNQDIKFGRLRVLNHLFTERLLKSLQESFVVSYGLVHQLGLSVNKWHEPINIASTRKRLVQHTSSSQDTLKEIIKHLNRSELDNLQRLWSVEVFAIDKHLTDFTKRSNNLPIEKILISGIGAIHRSHAKKLAKIQNELESTMLLILLYYLPIIPDDDDHHHQIPVQDKEYFRAWFADWFTTLKLFIQKSNETVQVILRNRFIYV